MLASLSKHRTLVICATLFLAAAVPRIAASVWLPSTTTYGDEELYVKWAEHLLAGQPFWYDKIKPPLYPGFLAAVAVGFGEGVLPIRAAQSVLAGVAAILVFFIGNKLFGERTGMIAAAIFALYPPAVYLATIVYPQAILTLFLAGAVLMALHSGDCLTAIRGIGLGLLIGLAVLCVEMAVMLLPAVLIWILLRRNAAKLRARATFAATVLMGMGLAFAPWMYRNHRMTGHVMPLCDYAIRCFWGSHLPGTDVKMLKFDDPDEFGADYKRERERVEQEMRHTSDGARRSVLMREAWQNVRRDGQRFLSLTAGKFVYFFWPWPEPITKSRLNTPKYKAITAACYLPLMILAIYGAGLAWRGMPDSRLLVAIVLFYAFGYSLIHVNFRYRLPIDPLMWVLSAYGAMGVMAALCRQRDRSEGEGGARWGGSRERRDGPNSTKMMARTRIVGTSR